jgi:hypothetical protein
LREQSGFGPDGVQPFLVAGVVVQVNQVSQSQRRDKWDRGDGWGDSDGIVGGMAVNAQFGATIEQYEEAFAIVENFDFV